MLPSSGVSVVQLSTFDCAITLIDLDGGSCARNLWVDHCYQSHSLVFVVDSADVRCVVETTAVLSDVLKQSHACGKPLFCEYPGLPRLEGF